MNGLPYYKRYPRDFLDGTAGMPFDLKGAYSMLLDLIYMQGGRLIDDPRYIAGHLGCSVRAWGNYRNELILRGKIKADLGIISNFRADNELIISTKFQDKQRINASEPRKNKDLGDSVAKPKGRHTDTDTESSSSSSAREPIAKTAVGGSDADRLLDDVLAAVGLQNGRLPTHWMPPAATMHVQRWVSDLGLTPQQIIEIAQKNRAQYSEPPNGPKALDAAMRRMAGQLAAPKLQPIQQNEGQNGQYRNTQSGQSASGRGNGVDPAIAQIARLAGLGRA